MLAPFFVLKGLDARILFSKRSRQVDSLTTCRNSMTQLLLFLFSCMPLSSLTQWKIVYISCPSLMWMWINFSSISYVWLGPLKAKFNLCCSLRIKDRIELSLVFHLFFSLLRMSSRKAWMARFRTHITRNGFKREEDHWSNEKLKRHVTVSG